MKPVCHPARPHAAGRLCKSCYYARYRRRKRLDELQTVLRVKIALRAAERQREHDLRKYAYAETTN